MQLKNNKAEGHNGFSFELFKTGSNECVGQMYQFIHNIAKAKYAQRLEPQCPLLV